jgi:hypothetical protein
MDEDRMPLDRYERVQLKPTRVCCALSVQPRGCMAGFDRSGRLKIDGRRQGAAVVLPRRGFDLETTLTDQSMKRHVLVVRGSKEHT